MPNASNRGGNNSSTKEWHLESIKQYLHGRISGLFAIENRNNIFVCDKHLFWCAWNSKSLKALTNNYQIIVLPTHIGSKTNFLSVYVFLLPGRYRANNSSSWFIINQPNLSSKMISGPPTLLKFLRMRPFNKDSSRLVDADQVLNMSIRKLKQKEKERN